MNSKGWLAGFVFALAMIANATVRPTEMFASDANGNAVVPNLGETFYVTVDIQSSTSANDPFTIHFSASSGDRQTPTFSAVAGTWRVTWGPFVALMEGPMTITAQIQETGQVISTTVTPNLPTTAIETFNPVRNYATLAASWSGRATTVKWWIPIPPVTNFQTVNQMDMAGSQTLSTPFAQPISIAPNANSVSTDFFFTSSAVRSNATLLRTNTFANLDAAAKTMKTWLGSEAYVETTSSSIASFVTTTLGKTYRTTINPYDAAQKLFLATIKKLSYKTGYTPDAVKALSRGTGDCACFTSVFVASCRHAGIPARAACGFTLGSNQWHVWAEFWLPNAGWIPADPTYADGLRPQGDLPLYFGVIPDLNQRLVTTYGFDHAIGSTKMPMLQSPALFYTGLKSVGTVTTSCSLTSN